MTCKRGVEPQEASLHLGSSRRPGGSTTAMSFGSTTAEASPWCNNSVYQGAGLATPG
jgi:hypothetical protein